MTPERLFQREGNLAHRRLGARRVDRERQQIAVAACSAASERLERLFERLGITLALKPRELVDLQLAHRGIVDFENVDRFFVARPEFVDPDHRLRAGIDARLRACRRLFDAQFWQTGFDGARHAAELFDFLNVRPGPRCKIAGQPLDKVRTAPWIDHACGAAFFLQHDLRIARDPRRKIRRQR